ncbi:class I SAM-dependent rRNA methyltransferase [Rosettibacter firmus]|uniref:class I SAM-dependent rRNA methyltransferase n=1 Tax=Rosettibacter firmus TaxID=3111522 RepID=UPI00336BC6D3
MADIILKKNEDRRIKKGHLWIFSNEIAKVEGEPLDGDLVNVYNSQNNFIAKGFYNKHSLISVRIISREKEFDLKKLFEQRILSAYNFRKYCYPDRNSFRLIFSESDSMPGLIIDKYNYTYVLQIYSVGMEKNIELILDILEKKLDAKNIFTKNEEYFRQLEGLPIEDKIFKGEMSEEIISDGEVKYRIDFKSSHKTGFYFDQCDNRIFASNFCKDKKVLDCFCNAGGFGLNAAKKGAKSITFVDSSKKEIENAEYNFKLNNFSCEAKFVDADVFNFLESCISSNEKYDIVIVDPPAFAKNKKSLPNAIKGYEKLNRLAMSVLNNDGILFTSSCSHHLKEEMFIDVINKAANKAKKKIHIFYFNNASLDHPFLPSMEETVYLKFAAVRIIE